MLVVQDIAVGVPLAVEDWFAEFTESPPVAAMVHELWGRSVVQAIYSALGQCDVLPQVYKDVLQFEVCSDVELFQVQLNSDSSVMKTPPTVLKSVLWLLRWWSSKCARRRWVLS